MEHIWTILCSQSVIDQDTNNVSLVNVIEKIVLMKSQLPQDADLKKVAFNISLELISLFKRTDFKKELEYDVRIVLLDEKKKEVTKTDTNFTFPKDKNRIRHRLKFDSIPFLHEGEYEFVILTKKSEAKNYKRVGSTPLEVVNK